MAKKRGMSFKTGTKARKAAHKIARGVARSGGAVNAYAVGTARVKKMTKSKIAKTAKKR